LESIPIDLGLVVFVFWGRQWHCCLFVSGVEVNVCFSGEGNCILLFLGECNGIVVFVLGEGAMAFYVFLSMFCVCCYFLGGSFDVVFSWGGGKMTFDFPPGGRQHNI
jgi:hypothetical protein